MKIARENIIASSGDLGLFPAATPVFLFDGTSHTLNGVLANQLVIYDFDTSISLSPGDVVTDSENIVVAQGLDLNGDGYAETLRGPFGDKISGCAVTGARAMYPICGLVDVIDVTANCVQCDKNYSLNITVEDDFTQNTYPFNRPATYSFTVNTGCCSCDSCENGIDEQALWCKMADQINGKNVGSATDNGIFLQRARNRSVATMPFVAYPLYENDYTYCINPSSSEDDTCNSCNYIDAITGITIGEGEDAVTVNFSQTTVGAAVEGQLSLVAQLPRIVDLINQAFAANGSVGSAVATRPLHGSGAPACCAFQLRINSCVPIELLGGPSETEDPLVWTPCATGSPFEELITQGACKGCSTPTASTPTAGLRIVAKPVDVFCNCYTAPDTPRGWHSRKLNVNVGQDSGFLCGGFRKHEVQSAEVPQGFGYEWQTRAANQAVGGLGRDYAPWNQDSQGRWGNTRTGSRGTDGHTGISCAQSYCVYTIDHNLPNIDVSIHHDDKRSTRGRTIVLIPSSDAITIAEFEAVINPYIVSTHCPIKAAMTCGD